MGYVSLIPQLVEYFPKNGKIINQIALGEAHTITLD